MNRRTVLALVALAAPVALAGDRDYYLSTPGQGAIWRVDADTLQGSAWATGLLIPHYGSFLTNGDLIMPDRGYTSVLRIHPDASVQAFTAGGLLDMPVTAIPAPKGDGMIVSDMKANRILHVDWNGVQTSLYDNTNLNGLLDWPDGMAFDRDGNLYIANLHGNTIVKVTPSGESSVFSDSPLVLAPGGIQIDGAGNLFAAMYDGNDIVRFRLDTGEAEVFATDAVEMFHPSDLKLARSGGLLATTRNSNLLRIDAQGAVTVVHHDSQLGEIVGIAVPEDAVPCSGTMVTYGTGKAGSGGIVPKLQAIFSPCPGEQHAIEMRDFLGGAPTYWFIGFDRAQLPLLGGKFLIDPSLPLIVVPFVMPGAGAGNGKLVMQFAVPDDPNLIGLKIDYQAISADPGALFGVSLSNGLEEHIGS